MKVLWFEVTPPGAYVGKGWVIGGWQDSLERIVRAFSSHLSWLGKFESLLSQANLPRLDKCNG